MKSGNVTQLSALIACMVLVLGGMKAQAQQAGHSYANHGQQWADLTGNNSNDRAVPDPELQKAGSVILVKVVIGMLNANLDGVFGALAAQTTGVTRVATNGLSAGIHELANWVQLSKWEALLVRQQEAHLLPSETGGVWGFAHGAKHAANALWSFCLEFGEVASNPWNTISQPKVAQSGGW